LLFFTINCETEIHLHVLLYVQIKAIYPSTPGLTPLATSGILSSTRQLQSRRLRIKNSWYELISSLLLACAAKRREGMINPFHPQGCLLLGLLRFHPTLAADTATQNPRVGLIRSRSQQIDFRLLLTARRSQLSATDPTRKALAVIDGLTKEIERTPKVGT
jgi:hypothetical protein